MVIHNSQVFASIGHDTRRFMAELHKPRSPPLSRGFSLAQSFTALTSSGDAFRRPPVSPDIGILDIRITTFVSAIDGLFAIVRVRSNAPTHVESLCMKSIINAIPVVKQFEHRPQGDRSDVVDYVLKSLSETTLSNLVTASKTQTTSWGMSSISLLDAVAYQPLLRRRSMYAPSN
ncbi:hypothetical protein PILCRDRAFT_13372 [Piloderma croceum F 1598]|uniref:C3G9 VBS-like domain-containing protein n=1 Tax=Piloderma croceum (strain F 1598) TaxID=765440 RepID=A0A0C3BEI3_PILCF|nr:hypothetical protein PILCRDRAFT_13372 [Piloderma croceum F 1598]